MVTDVIKRIQLSKEGNDGVVDFKNFFPQLTVLIRDFYLKLEDRERNKITPDQYLSNCFAPKQSTDKKQIEQNAIRATITDCLPVFDCSVLSRPCEAEDLLRLDSMPDAELKALFKEQLQ